MSNSNNRRTTLGGLSNSATNTLANSRRTSLGPSRVTNEGGFPTKPRASIGVALNRTSDARRSSTAGAAPSGRRSSMVPRTSTLTTARTSDPRNITDKRFVPTSIHALIDYLSAHNFDHIISPKILTSPSAKDFNNIVQFLFKQIDPNLACPGKFEDEVITMFKYIRYPYSISKNGLSAVGSPHCWPQILAAVMWLIELLEYDEVANADNDDANNDNNNDIEESTAISDKLFFTYLRNAYISFLNGNDPLYAQLEEEFVQTFETKNEHIIKDIKELENSNDLLMQKINEIENKKFYLPQLQTKKLDYENDLVQFQDLITQLNKHKETLLSKKGVRQQEIEKLNSHLNSITEDIEGLKAKISNQSIHPEDVLRMTEEKEHLHISYQQSEVTFNELQKKVWDAELILRDKVQSLEEAVRLFNSMSEDLPYHVVKGGGGGGGGKKGSSSSSHPLVISIDTRAKKRNMLLQTDIAEDILPYLHQIKSTFSEKSVNLHSEMLTLNDSIDELEISTIQNQEKSSQLENKLKRIEETYKKEKELLEMSTNAHDQEMDRLEHKLTECRDVSSEEVRNNNLQRKLMEVKLERNACKEEHKMEKRKLLEEIMNVVTEAANHREDLTRKLAEVREMHQQRLESLLNQPSFAQTYELPATLPVHANQQQFTAISTVKKGAPPQSAAYGQSSYLPPPPANTNMRSMTGMAASKHHQNSYMNSTFTNSKPVLSYTEQPFPTNLDLSRIDSSDVSSDNINDFITTSRGNAHLMRLAFPQTDNQLPYDEEEPSYFNEENDQRVVANLSNQIEMASSQFKQKQQQPQQRV